MGELEDLELGLLGETDEGARAEIGRATTCSPFRAMVSTQAAFSSRDAVSKMRVASSVMQL